MRALLAMHALGHALVWDARPSALAPQRPCMRSSTRAPEARSLRHAYGALFLS